MAILRMELVKHCGGEPSIAEGILIDRVIAKVLRCRLYEVGLLSDQTLGSRDHYLAVANSLRLDLQALGLERKVKDVLDLEKYLKVKEGKQYG